MLISLLFLAFQDSAPQVEPEATAMQAVLNKIEEISQSFTKAGTKLRELVDDADDATAPTSEQPSSNELKLREAVQASEQLVAEMEALLEILPDG